jgi:AcrR family transcriptional regulator
MKSMTKMSGEERKESILKAVRKVFANKGFRGITSRELASAAGISEALLFRHFPNKEALYAAIQESCCRKEDVERLQTLETLENSTTNLVYLVHLLVTEMFRVPSTDNEDEITMRRLFLRSITEDGELVRLFLKGMPTQWVQKTELCLQAAIAAGDANPGPAPRHLVGWFSHHLAAMVAIHLLPETPIVDYGISREDLIEQTVWFALRGMGVKDDVIARCLAQGTKK